MTTVATAPGYLDVGFRGLPNATTTTDQSTTV